MANQTVVTCQGVTKAGSPCKQTKGLVDGFCSSHRPNKHKELLEQVKKTKRSGAARKAKKVAKPLPGANEELLQAINEVETKPESVTEGMKLEFIGGKWVEVPIDVQSEVINKAEELAKEEEANEVLLIDGMSFDEATRIIAQYEPMWSIHFTRDSIGDTREFAELLLKVVRMSYEDLTKELMAIDAQVYDINELVNSIIRRYPANLVPAEEQAKIDSLKKSTVPYKQWKALLLCRIDYETTNVPKDEPVVDMKGDKPSKLAVFFAGLLDKGSKWMTTIGMLLVLVAIMYFGEKSFDTPPETIERPPVVFEENPDAGVEVPVVVDDTPVDNADKTVVRTPVIDLANDDIVPVPVDTVVVQDGDTLWDIAVKVYDDGSQWTKIYDANADSLVYDDARNFDSPGHWIHAGQVLDIPLQGGDIQ